MDKRAETSSVNQNQSSGYALGETFGTALLVAVIWVCFFIFLRPKLSWKYSARSHSKLLPESARTPELPKGYFNWISAIWKIPDSYVLTHESLDSYLFLRFLKLSAITCILGCPLTWLILLPVNATGGNNFSQLDRITTSNIKNPARYWAHVLVAWIYFGSIMFLIARESVFYINLRQAYLMQPSYKKKLSSRTVLIRAVPDEYLNESRLRRIFGPHVVRIWFPTDQKALQEMVVGLEKIALYLEQAETKLIKAANGARLKSLGKQGTSDQSTNNGEVQAESSQTPTQWLAAVERPTHREKIFGGNKVDTIDWARAELRKVIPIVKAEQQRHRNGEAKKIRAVFVEFDSLGEAQSAYQSLTHHQILTMTPRFTGIHPTDIIWYNLRMRGSEHYIRLITSAILILAFVALLTIPVIAIGAISNANVAGGNKNNLKWLNWLSWLNKFHGSGPINGFVTGLLPSILLTLILAIVPIILRYLAIFGGAPSYTAAESTVQHTHFAFQVYQTFISAIGSAAFIILGVKNGFATLFASSLPKVSNFFINYIIVQGFGIFGSILVGLAGIFLTPLLATLSGFSPRKTFLQWNRLAGVGWGTVYPRYTTLFVIAITYSCLSPIILLFCALTLLLLYIAHRYNILFVYDTGVDMKGSAYPAALQHLFVGLYIAELVLLCIFAAWLGDGKRSPSGPLALMVILLVFTILFHAALYYTLNPLITYLPKTLEADARESEDEPTGDGNGAGPDKTDNDIVSPTQDQTTESKKSPPVVEVAHVEANNHAGGQNPGRLARFFKPHIYEDYAAMRRLLESKDLVSTTEEIDEGLVRDAYLPPAVWAELPHLIIPRDEMGISTQECQATGEILPCTDDAAKLDERNRIVVDNDKMREILFAEKGQRIKEY